MNEMETCYWHSLNTSQPALWAKDPEQVLEKLLVNALFAKMNSNPPQHADVFKSFILHNHKEVIR